MRIARVLLVIVAVVCLGVALSYPLRYRQAQEKNDTDLEGLAQMRQQARQSQADSTRDDVVFPALPGRFADDLDDEAVVQDEESEPDGGMGEAIGGADEEADQSSGESPSEAFGGNGDDSSEPANIPEGPSDRAGDSGTYREGPSDRASDSGTYREGTSDEAGDRLREDSPQAARGSAENRQSGAGGVNPDTSPVEGLEGTVVPVEEAAPTPVPEPTPTPEPTR